MLGITIMASAQKIKKVEFINPTGVYKGAFPEEIRVKLLGDSKIAIAFLFTSTSVNVASYNVGSDVDTLLYKNNTVTFRTPEMDSTCKIIFTFFKRGVKVQHDAANYNWSCGFGQGVIARGFFEKVSSKVPKIKDLAQE